MKYDTQIHKNKKSNTDEETKTTVKIRKNVYESLQALVEDRKRVLREIETIEVIVVDRLTRIVEDEKNNDASIEASKILLQINKDRLERESQWSAKEIDPILEIFDVFTHGALEKE